LAAVAALDLYVSPSLRESLPLSVLEAMLLERPVLAAAAGDLEDVLERGRAGMLVPSGDVDALAEAIDALAADRDFARALAARGAAVVRERFAPERLAREVENAWLDVQDLRPA
jgi:glycosyltransferase involved in cell wall biosynthesis